MDLHYNAFISYKHAPADIAVAKDIQHQLEHFHVPKAIRKKTGKDKIERIFRDQEELPITADLNNDIAYALEDAEFLIVICSSSTKLSTWVPREIAAFLKTHDRNHILTVLVDGEPNDVIPEILRKEVANVTDSEGNQHEEIRIFEPLSCDYRAGIRQARKTEIPRLAAALLGCSYDELVMRARQYKMRRITSFATAGGILMATALIYLVWSNHQITLNLLQAQRNQSIYLANEAHVAIENENRIVAAGLALAALPTEDRTNWPYIPEAEYALSQAIGAYQPRASDSTRFASDWNMSMRSPISDYIISPDNIIYSYDSVGDIAAWDLDQYTPLFSLETGLSIYSLEYMNGKLIQLGQDGLWIRDSKTGSALWSYQGAKTDTSRTLLYGSTFYATENFIYLLQVDSDDINYTYTITIRQLSFQTGECVWESSPINAVSTQSELCLSDDGQFLVFSAKNGYQYSIYRCSLVSGAIDQIFPEIEFAELFSILPGDESRIILYGSISSGLSSYDFLGENMRVLSPTDTKIYCVDYQSENILWENGFTSYGINMLGTKDRTVLIDYNGARGDCRLIGFFFGDEVFFYNQRTGKLFDKFQFDANIVGQNVYTDGSGYMAMLQNGYIARYSFDTSFCSCIDTFSKQICYARLFYHTNQELGFVVLSENHLMQVYDSFFDDSLCDFADAPIYRQDFSDNSILMTQDYVLLLSAGGDTTTALDMYDLESKTFSRSISIPKDSYNLSIMGVDEEENLLYIASTEYGNNMLLTIDLEKGELLGSSPIAPKDQESVCIYCSLFWQNQFVFFGSDSVLGQNILLILQIMDDGNLSESEMIPIPLELSDYYLFNYRDLFMAADDIIALSGINSIYDPTSKLILYHLNTGNFEEIVNDQSELISSLAFSNDKIAFSDGASVKVYSLTDLSLLYQKKDVSRSIMNVYATNEAQTKVPLLLVLYSDHILERYNLIDGTFLGSSEVAMHDRSMVNTVLWEFTDTEIILQVDGLITFLDRDTWERTTAAKDMIGYDSSKNLFVAKSIYDGCHIQYCERYSLDQLIQKGYDFLKGCELSETQKNFYGIE